MTSSADLEALLNIIANAVEMIGISSGFWLVILCFIPHSNGLRGYTSKMAILGVVMAVAGLAFPGIVNLLVASARDSHTGSVGDLFALLLIGILTLAMAACYLVSYFLPSIIAYREKRQKMKAMIILNIFAFIPFVWLVNLIWACMPPKDEPVIKN